MQIFIIGVKPIFFKKIIYKNFLFSSWVHLNSCLQCSAAPASHAFMSLPFLLYKLVHQSSLNFLIHFSFLLRFSNIFFFIHWLKALRWRGVRHTGLDFGETQAGFVIGTLVLGLSIFLAVILGWERVSVFYFIFLLLILWFFSLCIVILDWNW